MNCIVKEGHNICKEGDFLKYKCPCGYVYDSDVGDVENGISSGTAWENLPDDWVCPVCGLGKEYFEEC